MRQYANLGEYSKSFVEFYVFSNISNRRIGSVFFIKDSEITVTYKVHEYIDEELIEQLKPIANEIMYNEK